MLFQKNRICFLIKHISPAEIQTCMAVINRCFTKRTMSSSEPHILTTYKDDQ